MVCAEIYSRPRQDHQGKSTFPAMSSPLLLSLFVPTWIYAKNRGEVLPSETLVPIGLVLAANLVLIGIGRAAKLEPRRFAVTLALFWVGFFHIGKLRPALLRTGVSDELQSILLPLALVGICALVWRIERVSAPVIAQWLTVSAVCLSVYPMGVLALDLASELLGAPSQREAVGAHASPDATAKREAPSDSAPDIFYLLLDGYTGQDVLTRYLGYDNEPFLESLRERGFVVMNQSRSNYASTIHSLASSFNLDYLDFLVEQEGEGSMNKIVIIQSIHDSRLNRMLKEAGYHVTLVLSSTHLLPKKPSASVDDVLSYLRMSQYALTLYGRTPLPAFAIDQQSSFKFDVDKKPWIPDSHQWVLEKGVELAVNDQRDFAFLHVLSPHEPFYFDENCDLVPEYQHQHWNNYDGPFDTYRDAYVGQLRCTNQMVERFLSAIDTRHPKAIVVIQGDHGPSEIESSVLEAEDIDEARFRSSILNAIRVPGAEDLATNDDMTPVNNFRLVLGHIGLGSMEKLEDRSYRSSYKNPYEYVRW
jgi:hypothetical protein